MFLLVRFFWKSLEKKTNKQWQHSNDKSKQGLKEKYEYYLKNQKSTNYSWQESVSGILESMHDDEKLIPQLLATSSH